MSPSKPELVFDAPADLILEVADLQRRVQAARFRKSAGPPWREAARPEQLPPEGPWRTWYVRGGRDSGKTWTASGYFAELIKQYPGEDWGVLAPTFAAARDVCIEGRKSGLIKALGGYEREGGMVRKWVRSLGQLYLTNGSLVYADGADDGAPRVQGKRLAGAWCDEIGLWQRWEMAWDESLKYAVTESPGLKIVTGTPKVSQPARVLIKRLTKDPKVATTVLRTQDNRAHIDPDVFEDLMSTAGTRLGRQELFGDILEDVEGALWTMATIEDNRVGVVDKPDAPGRDAWTRTVVALDPSDGGAASDEQGIAVVSATDRLGMFVHVSEGMRESPAVYMRRAIELALEYDASIVIEKNHGGAYLISTLEQVMRDMGVTVPHRVVNANEGKRTRAEPVSALYEQGAVHHVGYHVELEDQMVSFTGNVGEKSPDRLDALVWAVKSLMANKRGPRMSFAGRATPATEKLVTVA